MRVTVTASGIGILLHALEKISNCFLQADGSMTRKYGGTWLGISS